MRATREVTIDAPTGDAWPALSAGAWGGPIRLAVGTAGYAGTVTVVDVDEDDRSLGCHVQARGAQGWAGVAAMLELRPAADGGGVSIEGDVEVVGDADERAGSALLDALAERVRRALADGEGSTVVSSGPQAAARADVSPADDPAAATAARRADPLASPTGSAGLPATVAADAPPTSLADDPAWRRRLAARAVAAVAVGAAAGVAIARRGRGR